MNSRWSTRRPSGRTSSSLLRRSVTPLFGAGMAMLLLSLLGCSLSTSSMSISGSVSSPFKSSSDSLSSSSGEREASYLEDVRDFTDAYVRSRSDLGDFRTGLSAIAARHGVTDWEADESTYVGIGEGLAKAKVTQMQLEVYKDNLAPSDPLKAAAIQRGYGR